MLSEASADLKAITSDLKTMFQVKHDRAKFGELQLESLLKDISPLNRLHFQKNIGHGIPDACIAVENGRYLCHFQWQCQDLPELKQEHRLYHRHSYFTSSPLNKLRRGN